MGIERRRELHATVSLLPSLFLPPSLPLAWRSCSPSQEVEAARCAAAVSPPAFKSLGRQSSAQSSAPSLPGVGLTLTLPTAKCRRPRSRPSPRAAGRLHAPLEFFQALRRRGRSLAGKGSLGAQLVARFSVTVFRRSGASRRRSALRGEATPELQTKNRRETSAAFLLGSFDGLEPARNPPGEGGEGEEGPGLARSRKSSLGRRASACLAKAPEDGRGSRPFALRASASPRPRQVLAQRSPHFQREPFR